MPSFSPVRALQRGLEVMQIVNQHNGIKAHDVARLSKIPRPTVYRLLETLETSGFIVVGPSDDRWRPTLQAKSLSSGFRDEAWIAQSAMPSMMALGRKILWPVDLVTFRNFLMVVRESTHAHSPLSVDVGMVGRQLPLLLTSGGRAYLAFSPEAERAAVLDGLKESLRPEDALAKKTISVDRLLDQVRSLGVGFRAEGYRANTSSISAPIMLDGRVQACLTVIWIKSAMSLEEGISRYRELLVQTCKSITEQLITSE